jgi:hypothetical protein
MIVSVADCVLEFSEAEILTGVDTVTGAVATLKLALVVPELTATEPGTVAAAGLLLESDTFVAAVGAADSVTVPLEAVPPTTLAGASDTEATVGTVEGGIAPPPPPPPPPPLLPPLLPPQAAAAPQSATASQPDNHRGFLLVVMVSLFPGER